MTVSFTYPQPELAAEPTIGDGAKGPALAFAHHQKIDSLLQRAIGLTTVQQYDEALALIDSVIRLAPQEPVGFLFHAAILQSRMLDYETFEDEKAFFKATSVCRKLAQTKVARRPKDAWAHFFLGSALGYEAFFLGKKQRYLEALRAGWQCLQHLETAVKLEPQLYDAYLGIGTYKYYRSKLSKNFSWLPFVDDEREAGISMIRQAAAKGRYSRYAAINGLAWILLAENRPEEALTLVDSVLAFFPTSRFFLWGAAEAAYRTKRYEKAGQHYQQILSSLQEEKRLAPYLEIVGRTRLAKVYLAASRTEAACQELGRIAAITLPREDRERGKAFLQEAATYRKNCRTSTNAKTQHE
ncbi:MAG: hypothetical protein ONA90_11235 [candidate division KSB1 bacterium]|nr:hypothetical protein [candidate division KSB1 bacterium]